MQRPRRLSYSWLDLALAMLAAFLLIPLAVHLFGILLDLAHSVGGWSESCEL
jgi:hypothetical protein